VSDAAFQLRGVTVRHEDVVALDGIDLSISAHARTLLLGPNGSGKSTLLALLDALVVPDAGEMSFDGRSLTADVMRDPRSMLEFRRRVGFVFQNADVQLFNPTVYDEMTFGPLQLGWDAARVREAAAAMMESMEIAHLASRATYRLSVGEKKRVAIASVLVTEPEVILLDEPTAGLDPRSRSHVIDLLASWKASGRTVVTATHDLELVEEIADRCVVLDRGRVAAEGAPGAILDDIPLLERTGLLLVHEHTHADGHPHRHPHLRRHGHH
jgi:cobalt/nickel transport system ATP-binding protein